MQSHPPNHKLIVALFVSPPWRCHRPTSSPHRSALPEKQHSPPNPPHSQAYDGGKNEAGNGQLHPMPAHPEYEACVLAVPAVAQMVAEETPRMLIVFVQHENAHSPSVNTGARSHVLFPDDTKKQRAGARHDRYVRKAPISIVRFKRLDDEEEKRVAGNSPHCVVGDARRMGFPRPGWVGEKGIETSLAALQKSARSRPVEVNLGA